MRYASPLTIGRRHHDAATIMVPAAAAIGVALVTVVPADMAFAAAVAAAGVVAVYRWPVVSLSALLIVGVGPLVLSSTGRVTADPIMIYGKVSPAHAILFAMLLCVLVKGALALSGSRTRAPAVPAALVVAYIAFFAWIAVSVTRNLGAYGINAPGQFRYSYLILIVPAYALLFLDSAEQRRRFFWVILLFSVVVPVALVPLIAAFKGWGVGPASRFYPAPVSLGLLYGQVALLLATERGLTRFPKWLARGLAFPVAALIVADSHRSVWLAALVLVCSYLLVGWLSSGVIARVAWLASALVAACAALAVIMHIDILGYLAARGNALVDPQSDGTSAWRLEVWSANLAAWRHHPLAGDGFGGYYAGNAGLDVATTIQPHNYYVQTLVTMGAVGMALLLVTVAAAASTLWSGLRRRSTGGHPLDAQLSELGLCVLISALAFSVAYAPSYYPAIWVGLGLAAASAVRRSSPARTA